MNNKCLRNAKVAMACVFSRKGLIDGYTATSHSLVRYTQKNRLMHRLSYGKSRRTRSTFGRTILIEIDVESV